MSEDESDKRDFKPGGPTLFPELDNCFRPLVVILKRSAIVHLIKTAGQIVAFAIVLYTGYQISLDLDDRKQERVDRQDERELRAWTRLRDPVGNDTGKGAALSVLLAANIDTRAADLSCAAVGRTEGPKCTSQPVFSNVKFGGEDLLPEAGGIYRDSTDFPIAMFSDSILTQSDVSGYRIDVKGFDRARFESVIATAITVVGETGTVEFARADLAFSFFDTKGTNVRISGSNISGAILPPNVVFEGTQTPIFGVLYRSRNWAWADAPPLTLKANEPRPLDNGQLARIDLCDPSFRLGSTTIDFNSNGVQFDPFAIGRQPNRNEVARSEPDFKKVAGRCEKLTLTEARNRFPKWYPPR
ncbi:hypothetical protein GB928_028340 [Shinella curvata]|uniref:Pentapeptide repeat protein n=1 Tax=Shinella curvata TaxID=1817964 RepID=A0ABT8XMX1_9HYPH|nr:hypothetical protein [Shinella curvata]MCJ8057227.1 hypothetical protein [Shinella curvata]MDO6125096.1 hypothetical protein [Shinella curvata]